MLGKSLRNSMALVDMGGNCFSLLEDPFNLRKERSERTQSVLTYNCGGYALGTFNWFLPLFTGDIFYMPWWKDFCKFKNWDIEDDDDWRHSVNSEKHYLKYKNGVVSLLTQEIRNNPRVILGENSFADVADVAEQLFDCGDFSDPAVLAATVKMMLKAFPDMREIGDFEEIREDEHGVIYAAGERDFHFVKYDNGIFSHKMGAGSIKIVDDVDDALYARGYVSEYFFFAKKR